ncbi:MAG: type II toxin-antitoxin system VapC family toxin [Akkermansiaceae bacterium]
MNSLDTNILLYAVNADCPEHTHALAIYQAMLDNPEEWIISDQILFEFYRLLRNPRVLERPLNHPQALNQITYIREHSGVQHCAYETTFWQELFSKQSAPITNSLHIFDRILAVTLRNNGVSHFYTRNTKDFSDAGFEQLVNPID